MTKKNPYEKYLTIEQREHKRCIEWLKYYQPTKQTLFWHTVNESKRTPYQQYLWNIMGGCASVPDFIFATKRKGYSALALELKPATDSKGIPTVVFNRDGTVRADKKDQWEFLQKLKAEGWSADFAIGLDDFMTKVKNYFE